MFERLKLWFRSALKIPDQFSLNWVGGGVTSKAGSIVSTDTAMQISAVFACVKKKSEIMASLPFHLLRKTNRGNEKAENLGLYQVIHNIANPEMTSFEFRRMMAVCELLCGEAFAEIVRDPVTFEILELWPIPNNYVSPQYYAKTNRLAYYKVSLPDGSEERILYPEQIWHWKGLSKESTKRYEPIRLAREALGLSLAAEEFGERFFSNGTNVGGIVEYEGRMTDEAYDRFKKDFANKYEGLGKSHRLIFLEQGAKFTAVNTPPDKAQFIDTRKYQVVEIARFFDIPLHMINDLERATFSNIEHQSIAFVTYSLVPWLTCIEQSAYKDLLLPKEQKKLFFKFNVNGLLRGDFKSQMEGFGIGIQNGIYAPNTALELLDLPTYEGGDLHMVNGNMIPVEILKDYLLNKMGKEGGNAVGKGDTIP